MTPLLLFAALSRVLHMKWRYDPVRPENVLVAVVSNYSIPVLPQKKPIILWTVANYSSIFTNYSPIILKKLQTQSNCEATISETVK